MTNNYMNSGMTVKDLRVLIADLPDDMFVIALKGDHVFTPAEANVDISVGKAVWNDPSDEYFEGYGYDDGFWEKERYNPNPSDTTETPGTHPVVFLGYDG
jgi:hypothetical protein